VGRDARLAQAIAMHQSGRLREAETYYERILRHWPAEPDALHFLGVLRHNLGKSEAGIELIRRSLKLAPRNSHAWLNLGNILLELDRAQDAHGAYEQATDCAAESADAWFNLGVCARQLQRFAEAISALDRAIALRPGHAPSHFQRGIAQRYAGNLDAAEADYRQALQLAPDLVTVYESLGLLLYRQGRIAEAALVYQQWLECDPRNVIAQHMAAAMSGQTVPERASDAYVAQNFDRFADSFEQNLQQLQYRAPSLTATALRHAIGADRVLEAVLDAGCGTGLCGPLLRPMARRLVGIDLSAGMIGKALGKNIYDELHVAELGAFLLANAGTFDAVVATDTLVYFGALEPVLSATRQALRPAGRLVLTLERMPPDLPQQSYALMPHGRYAHQPDYVATALRCEGFDQVSIEAQVLRKEKGEEVVGLIVSARRIGADAGGL
jgi:predicted TPR repeat methyltransferase